MGMHMNSFNNRIIDERVHRQKECVQGRNRQMDSKTYATTQSCMFAFIDLWIHGQIHGLINSLIPGFMSLPLSLSINLSEQSKLN